MIRGIIKFEFMLKKPSVPVTEEDLPIVQDLIDTQQANMRKCVGLAANMIGKNIRAITYVENDEIHVMLNPEIIEQSDPYRTTEACLSLIGQRVAQRYDKIKVRYQDMDFEWHEEQFKEYTAEIIQHEIDHCNGIVI